jgi:hypothetical protein
LRRRQPPVTDDPAIVLIAVKTKPKLAFVHGVLNRQGMTMIANVVVLLLCVAMLAALIAWFHR